MLLLRQIKKSLVLGIKTYTEFKLNFNLELIIGIFTSFLIGYLIYYYTGEKSYILYFLLVNLVPNFKFKLDYLIKSGELDKYLVFPINFFIIQFFMLLGRNLFKLLIRVLVVALFSLIFNIKLNWVGMFIYLPLALIFNALFNFLVEILAFFVYEYIWFVRIIDLIELFFRGKLVPLEFLPKFLQIFSLYSFFPLANYYIYLVSINKLDSKFIINYFIWFFIFLILTKFLWKIGLKKYDTQFN